VAESLRRSEATLRSIMDHLHVGVVMCTETLAPVQVNRQMRLWFPDLGEDGGGSLPGDLLALLPAAGTQGTVPGLGEHTVVLPTVLGERVFKMVLQPVQNGSHQAPAVIGLFEDVTDALTAERELRQAQKLEAIGQLAAGIAHEINTPIQYVGDNVRFLGDATTDLAAILAGADRLCRAALAGEPTAEPARSLAALQAEVDLPYLLAEIPDTIEQTLEGVERVATIVRAMREFSHPGTDDKTLVDINRALESTITVSRNEWKYVAEVATRLADDLPLLSCLPGELNQVFLNILVNAAHAIADQTDGGNRGKGVITVSTRADERWLEVRIADTGGGIPAHIQERIFDPFFTTKGVGRGTGQGLAIARSVVVDKHRGRLRFVSDPGRGTTFVIELPLHRPEPPPAGTNEVIPER
jgi:signal transduction histidine kinase